MECRYFQQGGCKFGSKCKYQHIKKSGLLDPPQWILSSYVDKDTVVYDRTYSIEEIRSMFYVAHRQGPPALEEFFIAWNTELEFAHARLCSLITKASEGGISIVGPDERTKDIRKTEGVVTLIQPVSVNNLDLIRIAFHPPSGARVFTTTPLSQYSQSPPNTNLNPVYPPAGSHVYPPAGSHVGNPTGSHVYPPAGSHVYPPAGNPTVSHVGNPTVSPAESNTGSPLGPPAESNTGSPLGPSQNPPHQQDGDEKGDPNRPYTVGHIPKHPPRW